METAVLVALVTSGCGGAAAITVGAISGIFSPWAKSKMDVIFALRDDRRKAIARWRSEISKYPDDIRTWDGLPEIIEYLAKDELEQISSASIFVTSGGPHVDHRRGILLKAIKRVEKVWGLV